MNASSVAVLTICSANYIVRAITALGSYCDTHSGHDAYLLIVDTKRPIALDDPRITVMWVEDLRRDDLLKLAFKYDILEFNTNVKPTIILQLLEKYQRVVYIDPDIYVCKYMEPVFMGLNSASIVLTPHCVSPLSIGERPDDIDLLRFGSFNLGFIALRRSAEALRFLKWWEERCVAAGFYEPQIGLAVDQKWVNLVPCYFSDVLILRNVGLNVAFWNLHERQITRRGREWYVNDEVPLYFVHFSSFDSSIPGQIAHKQERFPIGSRPDFTGVADEYVTHLEKARSSVVCNGNYGYGQFSDGSEIGVALRRIYAATPELLAQSNPFSTDGPVHRFAKLGGFIDRARRKRTAGAAFRNSHGFETRIGILQRIFKCIFRMVGPNHYYDFMRFLVYYSSVRNQTGMFRGELEHALERSNNVV